MATPRTEDRRQRAGQAYLRCSASALPTERSLLAERIREMVPEQHLFKRQMMMEYAKMVAELVLKVWFRDLMV